MKVEEASGPPLRNAHRKTGLPISLALGALSGLMIYSTSMRPLLDIDVYWHVLAGAQLASGSSANEIGLAWSFAPDPGKWVSTQWLSELLFFGMFRFASLESFIAFRVVTTAAILSSLAVTTLRYRDVRAGSIPFSVAGLGVAAVAQERPQQFTFIGAAVLGGILVSGLYDGRVPRWWIAIPVTILWANLHGGWILAPAIMLLAWVGRLADHGPKDQVAWRQFSLGLALLACGLISPAGVDNLTAVMRFSAATGAISEWERTIPMQDVGLLTIPMFALICWGWAKSSRVPQSELLAAFVLTVFIWLAWRNVVPGLLVLAPLVARRLELAFPQLSRSVEPQWSRRGGVAVAGVFTMLALITIPGRTILPDSLYPVSLAKQISSLPNGQRVLNDYDVAGLVLFFGGKGTQVAIDGRSDRYGSEYIEDYAAMASLRGEWKQLLTRLDPTSALIRRDTALAFYLEEVEGWQETGEDGDFVLLSRPSPR